MKPALILTCIFGVAVFSSCKKNNDTGPDSGTTYLARMTNYLGTMTYDYDDQNRLVTETFETADASTVPNSVVTHSEFNSTGSPSKLSSFYPATSVTTTAVLEYDANDRTTKITFYTASGMLSSTYVYTYNGNTTEETVYNHTGAVSQRTVTTHGADGNLVTIQYYDFTGNLTRTDTYTGFDDKNSLRDLLGPLSKNYRSKNNPTAYTARLSPATTYQYTVTYEYNADGYPVKMSSTNTTTGLNRLTTYEYFKK